MPSVSDQLRDWVARFEIVARGVERRRFEAVRALESGRPWEARSEALGILSELPQSPIGLLLWADAAEAMMLDNEAVEALERLSGELPFRADVWLRLALVQKRLGRDPRRSLERAAEVGDPLDAADAARLDLSDRDLANGDSARAERWLERLSLRARRRPDAQRRRVATWLATGQPDRAALLEQQLPDPTPVDAHGWLLRARVLAHQNSPLAAHAFARALLLDAAQAERFTMSYVAHQRDPEIVARLRDVAESLKLGDHPGFRAAFAMAAGRTRDALAALAQAADRGGDHELFQVYFELALELRDSGALLHALDRAAERGVRPASHLVQLGRALRAGSDEERLRQLDEAGGSAATWAGELRRVTYRAWLPAGEPAAWPLLLQEANQLARELHEIACLRELEAVAVDLERPLRVAVLGEFNAGKSSFINAFLGETVAPTGVLPTTATVNRLVWAPDRFARIERFAGEDRIVPHGALKATLDEVGPSTVSAVTIYAPLEPLRHLELLDTPGFNSGEAAHAAAARSVFERTHVVIWLCDGVQPLKESERAVLAEIAALGVHVIVLLNKLDRVRSAAPDAAEQALLHVSSGLEQARVPVTAEPILFSAREALQGRSGDAAALERSNWAAVERLMSRVLVDRSAELRDAALRRRLAGIVRELSRVASARAEQRALAQTSKRKSAELLQGLATRHAERREAVSRRVHLTIERRLEDLDRDLLPVVGRAVDAALLRYVSARAKSVLTGAIVQSLLDALDADAEASALVAPKLTPRVSAVVAAIAPWLTSHSGGVSETPRQVACEQLTTVILDELGAVLAQGLESFVPLAPLPPELRIDALLSVLASA